MLPFLLIIDLGYRFNNTELPYDGYLEEHNLTIQMEPRIPT